MALGMDAQAAQRSQVSERVVAVTGLDENALEAEEAAAEGRRARAAPPPLTEDVTKQEDLAELWRVPQATFDAAEARELADDAEARDDRENRRRGKLPLPPIPAPAQVPIPVGRGIGPVPVPARAPDSLGIAFVSSAPDSNAVIGSSRAAAAAAAALPSDGRRFQREIRSMMYGFGDDKQPVKRSVELLEELAVDYVYQLLHRAQSAAEHRHKGVRSGGGGAARVQERDLIFALRKDARRQQRVEELLEVWKEVKAARGSVDDLEKEE